MFGLGYDRFKWSAVTIACATLIVFFVLQAFETIWMHSNFISNTGELSINAIKQGQVWRLISYAFVHDGFWHMLFNVIPILLIGLPLEGEVGKRAMALIMALMALAGGLAFTLVHANTGGALMGASAVSIGLLTLFCLSYPDRPITLLLFFVLPVTLLPKYVLYFTLGINLFGFVFGEIAPGGNPMVGYSAHLGGMLAAWAVSRWCLKTYPATPKRKPMKVEPPQWAKKKIFFKGNSEKPGYSVNMSSRQVLQKEVDRILDKINTKGFGSLTSEEKETLDKAKDILGK